MAKLNFEFPECSLPQNINAARSREGRLQALKTATIKATAFAQECSSSVQEVWMLLNNEYWLGTRWYVYVIIRNVRDSKEEIEVVCCDDCERYMTER